MASNRTARDRGQSLAAPRRLLARVRDVMAETGAAEERLDHIIEIIAADMAAEVCSVYVRRAGDILELFATRGLEPAAVHNTRLNVGEGIVGDVAATARPLALADAQAHPNFAYRPETGEEIYHSMVGVPVLRGGRVIGVIAVQNRTQRNYSDEEIETLQTVAMVLAELIAGGELISRDELLHSDSAEAKPVRLEGLRLNAGLGMGTAVLHQSDHHIERLVGEDAEAERLRLAEAFSDMHGALDDMLGGGGMAAAGEHRDVLEAYRLIAEDAGWLRRIEEAIDTGLSAEAAVQKVQNDIRARMGQIPDPYLRERIHDLDDLAHRLTAHLLGVNGDAAESDMPPDAIVIARSMGPAQLLDFDRTRLRGLVLEEGSPTSHVAIMARALGIPVIGRVRNALSEIGNGNTVIVDSDHGQVLVRPGAGALSAFREGMRALEEQRAKYAELHGLPAETLDGEKVDLRINAGLMIDLANLQATGADGIGLFRTEIPFMVRARFPRVDEQTELYGQVLDEAGDKPVVFRTLDIGGDKILPYWENVAEDNPAMGWRAIRMSLDRPALLRQQLRALIRAAAGRTLRVMFPMIAEVAEFDAARALLDKELNRERGRGAPLPDDLHVGVMLEVPSLAFQLPALLERIDFLSVGSNDLVQFLFASDRGNPRMADRYDTLSPILLKYLKGIVDQCRDAGVPVGLCGEMAGHPVDAMALLGLGFRRISVAPANVGPVKAMIRGLSVKPLARFMEPLYDLPDHSVRERLAVYATEQGIPV